MASLPTVALLLGSKPVGLTQAPQLPCGTACLIQGPFAQLWRSWDMLLPGTSWPSRRLQARRGASGMRRSLVRCRGFRRNLQERICK